MKKIYLQILTIVLAFVFIFGAVGVYATWVYADGDVDAVSSQVGISIYEYSDIKGIYISGYELITSNASTSVKSVSNDEQNLTATINLVPGSAQAVLRLKFFNNTTEKHALQTVSGSLFNSISSCMPETRIIKSKSNLTCDVVFNSGNYAQNVVFNFTTPPQSDKPASSVVGGSSSDNINTVGDGNVNISGETSYRWTNWEPVSGTFVEKDAVLALSWSEQKTISQVNVYHFVDAGKPYPCDFPASIKIEYFDGTAYQTLVVANLSKNGTTVTGYSTSSSGATITQNWSNAARTGTNQVYNMTIDGAAANFASGVYQGVAPCTTFAFDAVATESLRITFTPQNDTFVGIVEVSIG